MVKGVWGNKMLSPRLSELSNPEDSIIGDNLLEFLACLGQHIEQRGCCMLPRFGGHDVLEHEKSTHRREMYEGLDVQVQDDVVKNVKGH